MTENKTACPFCGDYDPYFSKEHEAIKCFACGATGPVIKSVPSDTWEDVERKAWELWEVRK